MVQLKVCNQNGDVGLAHLRLALSLIPVGPLSLVGFYM